MIYTISIALNYGKYKKCAINQFTERENLLHRLITIYFFLSMKNTQNTVIQYFKIKKRAFVTTFSPLEINSVRLYAFLANEIFRF